MMRCQLKKAHHEVQVLHNALTCQLLFYLRMPELLITKKWNYLTAPKSLLEWGRVY